jgi:hypothetical protein
LLLFGVSPEEFLNSLSESRRAFRDLLSDPAFPTIIRASKLLVGGGEADQYGVNWFGCANAS